MTRIDVCATLFYPLLDFFLNDCCSLADVAADAAVDALIESAESAATLAAQAEDYRRSIAARLEATLLPGLQDALATSIVTTPRPGTISRGSIVNTMPGTSTSPVPLRP